MKRVKKNMLFWLFMMCLCSSSFLCSMSYIKKKKEDAISRMLFWACKTGKKMLAKLLIQAGANIEAKDNDGLTPLICASDLGYKEIVKLLIQAGANIEAKDSDGFTPLICAADQRYEEIIELLLEKGANIEAKDDDGFTPLMCASELGYKEIAERLLKKGVDIEAKNNDGLTSLQLLWVTDNKEFAKLLIENGANIDTLYNSNERFKEAFKDECRQYSQLNAEIKKLEQKIDGNKDHVESIPTESINTIDSLMLDVRTPTFAKQLPLVYLLKYHTFFPDKITKSMLLSYYKKIIFNNRFFNDNTFEPVMEFALQENAQDKHGRSVLVATLFDSSNTKRDKVISKVVEMTDPNSSLRTYLAQEQNEKDDAPNSFIKTLRFAKKREDKQLFKIVMNSGLCSHYLQCVEYGSKEDKKTLPPEIAAKIMSYMGA